MKLHQPISKIIYVFFIVLLSYLLYREYTYVHPFYPGGSWLGPRWTYVSTQTITWWFILITSLILCIPLFRKQYLGFLGLILFSSVIFRPFFADKFPEETNLQFYSARKIELNKLVADYPLDSNAIYTSAEISKAGFEQLIVRDSIYYFAFFLEYMPWGLAFKPDKTMDFPKQEFDCQLMFKPIEDNWYEFDIENNN